MNITYLDLTNFRSHAKTHLDLSDITTAVITGKNGHGKSSIVFALTYVFWGEVPDVNLIDLVRKGAKQMEVAVEFIHDDGETYRLTRTARVSGGKKRSVSSTLTLQRVMSDGTFTDCSGNAIPETTAKVSAMLGGLSYETALYSNFILQDESAKFMDAEPGDRRHLFEEILNLGVYEKLEEIAKNKMKDSKAVLNSMDVNQTQEEQLKIDIDLLNKQIIEQKTKQKDLQDLIHDLVARLSPLEGMIGSGTTDIENRLKDLYQEASEIGKNLNSTQEQISKCEVIIAQEIVINEKSSAIDTIQAFIEKNSKVKCQFIELTGNLKNTKQQLVSAESLLKRVSQQITDAEVKRTNIWNKLVCGVTLPENTIEALQKCYVDAVAEKEKVLKSVQEKEKEISAEDIIIEGTIKAIGSLQSELKSKTQQKNKIEQSGSLCPVFNKECSFLSEENKKNEITAITNEINQLGQDIQTKQSSLASSQAQQKQRKIELSSLNGVVASVQQKMTRIESDVTMLKNFFAEHESTVTKLTTEKSECEKTVKQTRIAIGAFEKEIEKTGFDEKKYAEQEQELKKLIGEKWKQQQQQLLVSKETHKQATERKQIYQDSLNRVGVSLSKTAEELEKRRGELAVLIPQIDDLKNKIAVEKNTLNEVSNSISTYSTQLGTCNTLLNNIRDRKLAVSVHQQKVKSYENLIKGYQMIRSFITENSIPKFQEFCNNILDYLGIDIRIRVVTIEEVIDSRTKEVKIKRVFKILVIDSDGDERDYKTWSGGERHRINLALRQALAMTLLNRSGAKMGLMVIDEGDTRLDDDGKDALIQLVEATSQGHFGYPAKVLFITHTDDLKDRFAVRISLNKTSSKGSCAKVSK